MQGIRNLAILQCKFLTRLAGKTPSTHCICHRLYPIRQCSSRSSNKNILNDILYRFRNVPHHAYPLLLLPCITLYLGVWQIKRRKWKIGLIEELERKQRLPGVEIPDDVRELSKSNEYEPFLLHGVFDHSRETYIGPRSLLGDSAAGGGLISSSDTIGVHVVTPFKLSGRDQEVLVNRGWISMALKRTNEIYRPKGEQNLVGVLRLNERTLAGNGRASSFDPRTGMWARRDLTQLSSHLGTSSLFFDQSETSNNQELSPGSPIPGQTIVQLRNEHLSYIFTWFSLTALMLLIWANRYLKSEDKAIRELLRQADQMKQSYPMRGRKS